MVNKKHRGPDGDSNKIASLIVGIYCNVLEGTARVYDVEKLYTFIDPEIARHLHSKRQTPATFICSMLEVRPSHAILTLGCNQRNLMIRP